MIPTTLTALVTLGGRHARETRAPHSAHRFRSSSSPVCCGRPWPGEAPSEACPPAGSRRRTNLLAAMGCRSRTPHPLSNAASLRTLRAMTPAFSAVRNIALTQPTRRHCILTWAPRSRGSIRVRFDGPSFQAVFLTAEVAASTSRGDRGASQERAGNTRGDSLPEPADS